MMSWYRDNVLCRNKVTLVSCYIANKLHIADLVKPDEVGGDVTIGVFSREINPMYISHAHKRCALLCVR